MRIPACLVMLFLFGCGKVEGLDPGKPSHVEYSYRDISTGKWKSQTISGKVVSDVVEGVIDADLLEDWVECPISVNHRLVFKYSNGKDDVSVNILGDVWLRWEGRTYQAEKLHSVLLKVTNCVGTSIGGRGGDGGTGNVERPDTPEKQD